MEIWGREYWALETTNEAVSSAIEEVVAGVSSVLEGRIEVPGGNSEVEGVMATGEATVVVAAGEMLSVVSDGSVVACVVRFSKEKNFVRAMELILALLPTLASESPKVR